MRRLRGRRRRTAARGAPRLCVLSRLWATAARTQLQLVPRAGLRRLRQHGRLAGTANGVLLLASRLSSVATALIAHRPRRFGQSFGQRKEMDYEDRSYHGRAPCDGYEPSIAGIRSRWSLAPFGSLEFSACKT